MKNLLTTLFGFDPKQHNVRTEILAGVTTFLTMAYMLALVPNILGVTGMDKGALFHYGHRQFRVCHNGHGILREVTLRVGSRHRIVVLLCLYRMHHPWIHMAVCLDRRVY